MKITILQPDIFWEDKSGNLDSLGMLISKISGTTDMVILPEMFNTGFSMNTRKLAEESRSDTFRWMKNLAMNCGLAICGSYIVKENQKYFNRFLCVTAEGEAWSYDKRHLFSMGGEDHYFTRGIERKIFLYKGFRINPVICYDLRFPVWIRNRNDFDLLVCVANWPDSRKDVWNTLLKARAIENQCFVAGVNRIGRDNDGNNYSGESVILDPHGRIIASLPAAEAGHATGEILMCDLEEFREKFPVWKESDDFSLGV
ncbi:MAG: amidohydrolase [Bacteroidales bacterium]|jgi:predicted amidohydrolase